MGNRIEDMAARILYIDCFSGVAGDMVVGALLDLGIGSVEFLNRELAKLSLEGWSISAEAVQAGGMAATRFRVNIEGGEQQPRSLSDIEELIAGSGLSEGVRSHCLAVFGRVARAEARAHGESLTTVHFHEVGMVDSIIDIVSACILFEELKPDRVISSPVTLGSGTVRTRHGLMPVPSPATAVLLMGIPVLQGTERQELATPTGAALISYFSRDFGPLPTVTLEGVGYGAGSRETRGPNLLRMILGERLGAAGAGEELQTQVLVETNIDDSTPEQLAYLADRLLAAGAADAWLTPVIMKKGRPGVKLSALSPAAAVDELLELIFSESPTFGVRVGEVRRRCLKRRIQEVDTPYGALRVKIGEWRGREVTVSPEYEDCRQAAEKHKAPLAAVFEAARKAWIDAGRRR